MANILNNTTLHTPEKIINLHRRLTESLQQSAKKFLSLLSVSKSVTQRERADIDFLLSRPHNTWFWREASTRSMVEQSLPFGLALSRRLTAWLAPPLITMSKPRINALDTGLLKGGQRLTISRCNELPQLALMTYHNSLNRLTITRYDDLW